MIAAPPHPDPPPAAVRRHRKATVSGVSVVEGWVGHAHIRCVIRKNGTTCFLIGWRP